MTFKNKRGIEGKKMSKQNKQELQRFTVNSSFKKRGIETIALLRVIPTFEIVSGIFSSQHSIWHKIWRSP